ncbi:hypothetical protein PHLGIDRAFT_29070 [Phlebiopsis gigantea 11061_1 CR5-6]|uniref:UBR-type domain-containing protein n=1 Tax=Phlebiopsis gigantea (strain 11061_1 CR5-6) TaxID=745531 RepID=A0A0C3NVF3_PHLG1|nr:hypothetical protein PHLGIDRAFT_29070 [Phlebiopsis gigantea 11061_1 CR5-6]
MNLSDILASQASLLKDASEALPHQFSQCTYNLGYIRQAVYLCKTCSHRRGICSACSIACHTDHEQLELFPKRRFRCDCPTSALAHPCALHRIGHGKEEENSLNEYGQNFDGVFCRCGREYDAEKEIETMIQCLACEDWYHESCLNLRERPSSRASSPDATEAAAVDDDAQSEASSSGLPPPLVAASAYDAFVCSACVLKIATLRRYAGTPGVLMVVRDTPEDAWKIIGRQADLDDVVDIGANPGKAETTAIGEKRPLGDSDQVPQQSKRSRADSVGTSNVVNDAANDEPPHPCLSPEPNILGQSVLSAAQAKRGEIATLGTGDVFLVGDWRKRWCRCKECLSSLQNHSYLLEEEETYEPPEDPDSNLSLEELGLRALQRLPREHTINSIHAFNQMRDQLMSHLRPFAEQDKEVTETDIRVFFEAKMAEKAEKKG